MDKLKPQLLMRRSLILFGLSLVLFVCYIHVYRFYLGWELPKTANLKRENAILLAKAEYLAHEADGVERALAALESRDENIYRSVFGLNSVPRQVRSGAEGTADAGFADADRHGAVADLIKKTGLIRNEAYAQSRSYDEIELMLDNADQMANSIPAICPVRLDRSKVRISSPFGFRRHPFTNHMSIHRGVDFSMRPGTPVYATGDGVVESVKIEVRGYGRQVVINHGFGYKTRYAHLSMIKVSEGMKVKRGDCVAASGNSGMSSGPHLHYEVIYRGENVNPMHYFDSDMSLRQYEDVLGDRKGGEELFFIHPMHRRKRR